MRWGDWVATNWWPHLGLCQEQGAGLGCQNQYPGSQSLSHSVRKAFLMPLGGEELEHLTQTGQGVGFGQQDDEKQFVLPLEKDRKASIHLDTYSTTENLGLLIPKQPSVPQIGQLRIVRWKEKGKGGGRIAQGEKLGKEEKKLNSQHLLCLLNKTQRGCVGLEERAKGSGEGLEVLVYKIVLTHKYDSENNHYPCPWNYYQLLTCLQLLDCSFPEALFCMEDRLFFGCVILLLWTVTITILHIFITIYKNGNICFLGLC